MKQLQYRYDEMTDLGVGLRPHWQFFFDKLGALGSSELNYYRNHVERQIHNNGITYNVYSDPSGVDRAWGLDSLPFIIPANEWQTIEIGLIQRAVLLNKIIADLYGEQTLIKNGLLPHELIFANPYFSRSCHKLINKYENNQQPYLYIYGADIVRSPNGKWTVLADRTQAPSGAGYALENRIVISRTFPDIYRACHVKFLAEFFRTLRNTLQMVAPIRYGQEPRVVLLTPGFYNETYFEHAYLARYLGYTLVEAADLTVRDQKVYLKSLDGLQPVHVILRRLDDDYCDPLELRSDSTLGIPGLVQAVRAGNVIVANALGTGALESPAFMGFMPSIARFFFNENLILPSVKSWWCGESEALKQVVENINHYIIKPTFVGSSISLGKHHPFQEPIFASRMDQCEQARIIDQISMNPKNYVGQERLLLSRAPIWQGEHFEPRPTVLRVFLVADGLGSYRVMPGGLTRVAGHPESEIVSMQRGGSSKDTWVLSDAPMQPFSLLPSQNESIKIKRIGRDLSSRVAENLFWLGRYIERCEDSSRLFRSILTRLTTSDIGVVRPLLTISSFLGYLENLENFKEESNILSAIHHELTQASLIQIIKNVYRASSTVRDRLSTDHWRMLTTLQFLVGQPIHQSEMIDTLNHILEHMASLTGLENENMTRSYGWRFISLGRRIERAVFTCVIVRYLMSEQYRSYTTTEEGQVSNLSLTDGHDPSYLDTLLELIDSSMTYRSRYISLPHPVPTLDLAITDETNPRSLAFQLMRIKEHVDELPRDREVVLLSSLQKIITRSLTDLRLLDIEQLTDKSHLKALDQLLNQVQQNLYTLSMQIERNYFMHV